MIFRTDYRFDKRYDLPLKGKKVKIKNQTTYVFDNSCINKNYKFKFTYESYYQYCYNMANFIATRCGLKYDVSDCLHDYFTFYLNEVLAVYPVIRICMNIPGQKEYFIFSFREKSQRDCFDFETGNYSDKFFDFSDVKIMIDDKICYSFNFDYNIINGYDSEKLSYFCQHYWAAYPDYSYILLDSMNENISKYEKELLEIFGCSLFIENETPQLINFSVDDFEFNKYKGFINKSINELPYARDFYVEFISADVTYYKDLNYIKINNLTYKVNTVLNPEQKTKDPSKSKVKGKYKKNKISKDSIIKDLRESYIRIGLKNILYEKLNKYSD